MDYLYEYGFPIEPEVPEKFEGTFKEALNNIKHLDDCTPLFRNLYQILYEHKLAVNKMFEVDFATQLMTNTTYRWSTCAQDKTSYRMKTHVVVLLWQFRGMAITWQPELNCIRIVSPNELDLLGTNLPARIRMKVGAIDSPLPLNVCLNDILLSHIWGMDVQNVRVSKSYTATRCFNHCGRNSSIGELKKCSRCACAWYCSVECQKADWKEHKTRCQPCA